MIWWAFKKLYEQGLIYKDYRSMHICPRCETTLAQSEVAEGYETVKDIAVTAEFELIDEPRTFVLAWTTTPWTLPGNTAVMVHPDFEYAEVEVGKETWIIAKELVENLEIDGGLAGILSFLENQFDVRLENMLVAKKSSIHHLESGMKNKVIQRKQIILDRVSNQYKN